jgi:hypothetical protein
MAAAAIAVTGVSLNRARAAKTAETQAPRTTGSDLMPYRLAATAAMVLILTAAAGSLSPWLSGLLAPFPIITAVLAGFTHAQAGAEASITLLAGLVPGLVSFALFFVVIAVALPALGIAAAFGLATATALALHAAIATATATATAIR